MAGTTRLELATSAVTGFTTTYNNAGTAKLPVSRTRLHELWVGLCVGKSCRWPRVRRTGNPLPNGLVSSCTPPVDLLYTDPHGSVSRNPPGRFVRLAVAPD